MKNRLKTLRNPELRLQELKERQKKRIQLFCEGSGFISLTTVLRDLEEIFQTATSNLEDFNELARALSITPALAETATGTLQCIYRGALAECHATNCPVHSSGVSYHVSIDRDGGIIQHETEARNPQGPSVGVEAAPIGSSESHEHGNRQVARGYISSFGSSPARD